MYICAQKMYIKTRSITTWLLLTDLIFFCLLVIFEGGVYDPADIDLVNKLNGVESEDLTPEVIDFFGDEDLALEAVGGFK